MLQDMTEGRLENEYRDTLPQAEDCVLCVRGSGILLQRLADNTLVLPTVEKVRRWADAKRWTSWQECPLGYGFRHLGRNWFLWMGEPGDVTDPAFDYENVRDLRQLQSKEICFGIMTGWHLYNWYRNSRFCGCCGGKTVHDENERMMRCPNCGNQIYPRIAPAVIVAVTDGDRLLLTKYAGRAYDHYALIAGFTEVGETIEQTVRREVMEEVGLRVKNLRYYKSQPWGVDGNVLMGFYCDLDGDDTIRLDERELSVAQWHHRDALPIEDDGISLTREMIRVFGQGREPKVEGKHDRQA